MLMRIMEHLDVMAVFGANAMLCVNATISNLRKRASADQPAEEQY